MLEIEINGSPFSGLTQRMPEYRAYIEGSDGDGHFFYFHPLICADDTEATEKAKQLVVGHAVELWCGERLVLRFGAQAKMRQCAVS